MVDSNDDVNEEQEYEEQLRRRLGILLKQFEAGKVKINPGISIIESLKKIVYTADGSIDLDTVDGSVRSMALAVEHFHDREELKKIASLEEIQHLYFKLLNDNFGWLYDAMRRSGLTPHTAGLAAKNSEKSVADMTANLDKLLEYINQFWEAYGDIALAHAEDLQVKVKGVFGGDLFPANEENIASKCGIYTDTIILPDPFLRSKHVFERVSQADKAYYLVKHALNLLQYRELACTELDVPIVVVLPDYSALDDQEQDFYLELGKKDALIHSSNLFGREFESIEDLFDFSSELNTIEKVLNELHNPSKVLFDTEWGGSARKQIEQALKNDAHQLLGTDNPGVLVASMALGRMGTSNELMFKAQRLRGSPIIDAPTSWQYYVWKQEYDAGSVERATSLEHLHINQSLQGLAGSDFQWLGNVPAKALIELREQGAMDEIRAILGQNLETLIESNPSNFYRTQDQVFDNLHGAIEQHQKKIAELKQKNWKFAGSDIGSWFVTGSLAISAAATANPWLIGAAFASDQLLGAP